MPIVTIGGSAPSPEQAAALRAAHGIPDADVITEALATLTGTDQIIVMRAGASYTATMAAVAAYIASVLELDPPAATAPAAFSSGQWTLIPIAGGLRFGITTLPSDGGSAITDLEYSTNNGSSYTSFGAATTGNYNVTGLSEIEYQCMVRAVNAVDSGPNSDMKAETPAAAGGGGGTATLAQPPARVFNGWGNSQFVEFDDPMTAGNAAVFCAIVPNGITVTDVVGSDTESFGAAIETEVLADQTHYYYAVPNAPALTGATITLSGNTSFDCVLYEVEGLGASLALDDSGSGTYGSNTSPWEFPIDPSVDGTFFIANMNPTDTVWPVGVSPVVASPASSDYSLRAYAEVAASGPQTLQINMTTDGTTGTTRAGGRSWIVLRAGS